MGVVFFVVAVILAGLLYAEHKKRRAAEQQAAEAANAAQRANEWAESLSHLRRYEPIVDVEREVARQRAEVEAHAAATLANAEHRARTREHQAAEYFAQTTQQAQNQYNQIVASAAQDRATAAEETQVLYARASHLEGIVKALENSLKGYGDDYLLPADDLLDELAEELDHEDAGRQLKAARSHAREMMKAQTAADCDYKERVRRETAIRFVLDAFNGKVDSILSAVKHDNFGKLEQKLKDAYHLVNEHGVPFKNARINPEFLEARRRELHWAVVCHELKLREREEQRRIREEMREEARAQKEFEKALKQAEKEEKVLEDALAKARAEYEAAGEAERAKFEAKLREMEARVKEAEERHQRAISMAQQTKRGHVYVISNIGSFGENVFKIGMTRRLDPMDRVKELGDASVPFEFDVHAVLFAEDAPALERMLHERFDDTRINRVNRRKEFFSTTLASIRQAIESEGYTAHFTMTAAAVEYRESLNLKKQKAQAVQVQVPA